MDAALNVIENACKNRGSNLRRRLLLGASKNLVGFLRTFKYKATNFSIRDRVLCDTREMLRTVGDDDKRVRRANESVNESTCAGVSLCVCVCAVTKRREKKNAERLTE